MTWVLVIVLLIPVYGVKSVTPLNEFPEPQACWSEQERVDAGMREAYPNDKSFKIDCFCYDKGSLCHVRESTNTTTLSTGLS